MNKDYINIKSLITLKLNNSNYIKGTLLIFIIIIVLVCFSTLNSKWKPEWDSAYFITLANSIVNGNGYTYLGYPSLKAPPGFALILSPIILLFGKNFLLLNCLILIFGLFTLCGIYLLFQKIYSKEYALFIVALVGTSFLFFSRIVYIMTDIPYFAVSIITIYIVNNFFHEEGTSIYNSIAVGVALAVSYMVRTIGLALILGFVIKTVHDMLLKRMKSIAVRNIIIVLVVACIPVLFWSLKTSMTEIDKEDSLMILAEFIPYSQEFLRVEYDEPFTHVKSLNDIVKRVIKNAAYYGGQSSSIILSHQFDLSMTKLKNTFFIQFLPLLIVLCNLMYGFFLSFKKDNQFFNYYVIFYLIILLITPGRELRYLLPIVPFILHYFILSICNIGKLLLSKRQFEYYGSIILIMFFFYFIAANSLYNFQIIKKQRGKDFYSLSEKKFMSAVEWLKNNTTPNAKIISVRAPWIVLLADRWCVSFPWVENIDFILDFILKVNPDFIVVGPVPQNKQKYLLPVIMQYKQYFELKFREGNTCIYSLIKM